MMQENMDQTDVYTGSVNGGLNPLGDFISASAWRANGQGGL
jgi:hypothetical protein